MTHKEELEQNYKLLLSEVDKIVPFLEGYAVEIKTVDDEGYYSRFVEISHHEGYGLSFEKEKNKIKVNGWKYPKFEGQSFYGGKHECTFTPGRNPEVIANHIKRSMLDYYAEYHKKEQDMLSYKEYKTVIRNNVKKIRDKFNVDTRLHDEDNVIYHKGVGIRVGRDDVHLEGRIPLDKIEAVLSILYS